MAVSNRVYIDNLKVKISSVKTCEDLARIKAEIQKYFDAMLADINKEIELLSALIINPTDLGSVITWIQTFISSNILGPYYKALLLQAELIAELAEIMALINSVVAGLTCNIVNFDNTLSGYRVPQFAAADMGAATFGAG